jgi:hypothetical protein
MEQISATGNCARQRWRVFQRPFDNLDGKIGEVAPITSRANQNPYIVAGSQ